MPLRPLNDITPAATRGRRNSAPAPSHPAQEAGEQEQQPSRRPKVPIEELPHDEAVNLAKDAALTALGYAAQTKKMLRTKLLRKGFPEEIADQALNRLEEVGLINDAAYAEALTSSRQAGRGLAASAIKRELTRKGVEPEQAAEAVANITVDDERVRARELAVKQARSTRGLPTETRVRRLVGMLARRGYSPGIAFEVAKSVLAEEGDEFEAEAPDLG